MDRGSDDFSQLPHRTPLGVPKSWTISHAEQHQPHVEKKKKSASPHGLRRGLTLASRLPWCYRPRKCLQPFAYASFHARPGSGSRVDLL